jgi:hypothetical protein
MASHRASGTVIAAENLLELEDGCVEGCGAVALEDAGYGFEEAVAEGGIFAGPYVEMLVS